MSKLKRERSTEQGERGAKEEEKKRDNGSVGSRGGGRGRERLKAEHVRDDPRRQKGGSLTQAWLQKTEGGEGYYGSRKRGAGGTLSESFKCYRREGEEKKVGGHSTITLKHYVNYAGGLGIRIKGWAL